MTTQTDTVLDQQTRDELQPPCEIATYLAMYGVPFAIQSRCQEPAEAIVRATCPCGPGTHLTCTPHSNDLGHCMRCRHHLLIVSIEPLR